MTKYLASRQVREALGTQNGASVVDIQKTPTGASIFVYRPKSDKWERSFSLFEISGEDIFVVKSEKADKFGSTVVKLYLVGPANISAKPELPSTSPAKGEQTLQKNGTQRIEQHIYVSSPLKALYQKKEDRRFAASRNAKFHGLVDRGVFSLDPIAEARNHGIVKA